MRLKDLETKRKMNDLSGIDQNFEEEALQGGDQGENPFDQ